MTNAFSKNYAPKVDTDSLIKATKISRIRTEMRKKALSSDDPEAQKRAVGDMGGLSKRGVSSTFKRQTGGAK